MTIWMSIEVLDGAFSASLWAEAHGDSVIEAAFTSGSTDWSWHRHTWGVVLELAFDDDDAWERFRSLPAVDAALDAVPDPVSGLIVYKGRGGSSGKAAPRKPRPLVGSGAAALPLPVELAADDILEQLTQLIERRTLISV